MTCAAVRELLAEAAEARGGPASALLSDAAGRHIASCAGCLEDLALVDTLLSGGPSPLLGAAYREAACALVAPLLGEWAAAPGRPDPGAGHHLLAWRHAQACPRCRAERTELGELVALAESGALGPAPDALPGAGAVERSAWNHPATSQPGLPPEAWNDLARFPRPAPAGNAAGKAEGFFQPMPVLEPGEPVPTALAALRRLALATDELLAVPPAGGTGGSRG